jgi:type VI secretion system VasD/TssJ family lipoprotein
MRRAVAFEWRLFSRQSVARQLTAAGIAAVMLTCLAGCGWIFGKQEKPMRVEVVLTGSSDLNFDGKNAQSVQVKVFLLRNGARFMGADPRTFFDPTFDEGFAPVFAKDTLATASVNVAPQGTASVELVVPYVKVEKEKPVLCVIADFYRPPGEKKERLALNIKKKTYQKVKLEVGKDWVKKAGK